MCGSIIAIKWNEHTSAKVCRCEGAFYMAVVHLTMQEKKIEGTKLPVSDKARQGCIYMHGLRGKDKHST